MCLLVLCKVMFLLVFPWVISTGDGGHALLTLMVFKFLLYLSSPNFPSDFAVLFLT